MTILRKNSFDAIRLFAALCVFFSHQFSFLGFHEPSLGPLGISLASTGLYIFFALSGYLIGLSLLRDSDICRFVFARALRIYPAAIVNTLFCAIVGAFITKYELWTFITDAQTAKYILHNASIIITPTQFALPGVLDDARWPVVNGSIWTIKYEILCYTLLLLLFVAGRAQPKVLRGVLILCLGISITGYAIRIIHFPNPEGLFFFSHYNWFNLSRFIMTFVAGAVLALASVQERPNQYIYSLFVVSACLIVFGPKPELARAGIILLLVLLVVEVGKRDFLFSEYYRDRVGDLSYGTFLYAYPIQNVLVTKYYNGSNALLVSFFCLTLTMVCAFLSWKLIEQPTLKLKDRIRNAPAEKSAEL